MEIPEFCIRASTRLARKIKTEQDTDPDYSPMEEESNTLAIGGGVGRAPGLSGITQQSPTSFSADTAPSGEGLLIPMEISPPLSRKKAWEERSVIRRSKVLASERNMPAPTLQYIDRQLYSIENWKDRAEESKKKRDEGCRKKRNASSVNWKTGESTRSFFKKGGGSRKIKREFDCESDDDDDVEDDMKNDAFDYEQLQPIVAELDPLTQFLGNRCIDAKNFDLKDLPYFVMGAGKGKAGGPPAFEFNSLWNYELDPLSIMDTLEAIKESQPWKKDPTIPDSEPQLLSIVACFSVGRQLDLKLLANNSRNIEYNPDRFAPLIMRIRNPKATALIFRSGKVIVTGTRSMEQCKLAARKYARIVQRLGFKVKVLNLEIQNISAHSNLGFRVRLHHLSNNKLYGALSYEPELFPGLIIPLEYPRVKAVIFCTGSVLMTGAKSQEDVTKAFNAIYPLVKMYAH